MKQDKMRAEFEDYLIKDGFDTKDMKKHCDTYKYENVQFLWGLWQAAQKREPLSDEDICEALEIDGSDDWTYTVARAIEAAHNITKEHQ